ncbi:recombinase family protein [Mesorhizobium sp. CGMCC 1.15528]|uniref:Recombinase family protein n=1 Tax=Mesorhizobium zhangyense TaxID=1776730 RepID=A0A7C9V970_9HYPH|nr:recombinase family protein [Mesorhizobium zhangyense]
MTIGASGIKTDRPSLTDAIRYARDGNTLTVWKLTRLGAQGRKNQ